MNEFDEIWNMVERNMKVQIPPFIKYVLKFCGYENCHTISTIEEDDFEYFEFKVREGGIIEFYQDKISEKDMFEGSTKTLKDFEIVRGHRKLLMAIVKVVKEKLDKNGVDGLFVVTPKRKKKNKIAEKSTAENIVPVRRKKQKFSPSELLNDDDEKLTEIKEERNDQCDPSIEHHKRVLFLKALSCLKNHSPEMYEIKLQEFKTKLSEDSMQLMKKSPDSELFTAKIKCPLCQEKIVVFHKLSASEYGSWNAYSFERHLSTVHKATAKSNKIAENKLDYTAKDEVKDVPDTLNRASVLLSHESNARANETNSENEKDYIFVVVPSPPIDFRDDNVLIEDFSMVGTVDGESLSDDPNDAEAIIIENRSIFKNGAETQDGSWYETKRIITYNTCGLDSIFAIYSCLYADDSNVRDFFAVGSFYFSYKFTELVDAHFKTLTSTPKLEVSSAWKRLYLNRNIILNEIFSSEYYKHLPNLRKDNMITSINCRTGLGEFFTQLSKQCPIIASAIEEKTCHVCKTTRTKIVPFLSISVIDLDVMNVQKSIDLNVAKERFCQNCNNKCAFKRILNKTVVLDVEPSLKKNTKFSLHNLTGSLELGSEYTLCGVAEFDPHQSHFIAHVKRDNDQWWIYDDLKVSEIQNNEMKDVLPFMLFYTTHSIDNSFKKALCNEEFDMTSTSTSVNQHLSIAPKKSTSNTSEAKSRSKQGTNMEWKRKRENGWKY